MFRLRKYFVCHRMCTAVPKTVNVKVVGQIAQRMVDDGRFEVVHYQICSLKGTDPIELMANKLKV